MITNHCYYCKQLYTNLLVCSRCKRISFCSKDCQKLAWKTHQATCFPDCLIPKNDKVVCKLRDRNGVRDLTQEEFVKLVKATYVIFPFFSKKCLEASGCKNFKETKEPELIDSVAVMHQGDLLGYGLTAIEKIPKGTIICGYGGMTMTYQDWLENPPSNRSILYSALGDDISFISSQFTSLGALANDGLPNCELKTRCTQVSYKGMQVPFEKVVVAVRDIEKGEMVNVDYGPAHAVKLSRYQIQEKTLERLLQIDFNLSLLHETGVVMTAYTSQADNTKLLKATELIYILTTPFALTLLHLLTSIDPKKSLKQVENLPPQFHSYFNGELKVAKSILRGLIKMDQKAAFAAIAEKISQRAFTILCELIASHPQPLPLDLCEKFGHAIDSLTLSAMGTSIGSFWSSSEKEEFKQRYSLKTNSDLPEPFKGKYEETLIRYELSIRSHLFS